MKTLRIYTRAYAEILKTFLNARGDGASFKVQEERQSQSELYAVRCAYEGEFPAEALTALLEEIAVLENPVYRHSAKLKTLALDLCHTDIHALNVRRLTAYLKENRVLQVEGYVTFRMAEYREKLDLMMYSLIKRLRLT